MRWKKRVLPAEAPIPILPEAERVPEGGAAPAEAAAVSFRSLGLPDVLCESLVTLGWKAPTRIQAEALPPALAGRDVIGLAETGSGKTTQMAQYLHEEGYTTNGNVGYTHAS